MFKIALVQNLSELRNYSYADLRKDLQMMKFQVISITKDNIETLSQTLTQDVDCVLFASNSLNDSKIYEYVCQESFISVFQAYLENGGATLVMHQNSLKEKANPLPFIDPNIKNLEKNYAGSNISLRKSDKFAQQYFSFPNNVTEENIAERCFHNASIGGNYWQLLRTNSEDWTPILEDDFGNPVIQVHHSNRIIFSSLLMDYQKHLTLLHNILINLIVENMSLAILGTEDPDTLGFSYFLNSLENNKLYYKRYRCDEESLQDLQANIRMGIHSAIMINDKTKKTLSSQVLADIDQYGVKLIQINDQDFDRSDSFMVHSVDKRISLQFSKLELRIQEELASGFVAKSFMKTVDVLMKLKEFERKGMTKGQYSKESISHVLEQISPHMSEDGSYDKTFGATCKVLWVFLEFLGANDKLTKSCCQYIRNNGDPETLRGKLDKHYILAQFEKDPQSYLTEHCSQMIWDVVNNEFSYITEYDFLAILKVALEIRDEHMLIRLYEYIKDKTDSNGEFFNCYVTANTASALIEMYHSIGDERYREKIRTLLFDIIIYLRQVKTETMSIEEELQLVCALYLFETEVSFPVGDLTELIFKTGTFPHDYHMFERHISHYQKTRMEIDDIISSNQSVQKENRILKFYKKTFFALVSLLVIAIYLMVYMVIFFHDSDVPVVRSVLMKIAESWPSLFSLLVVPFITFLFDRFIKKRENK